MKYTLLFIVIFCFSVSAPAKLLESQSEKTHAAASYGFALTSTLIFEKELGFSRDRSILYAALTTLALGFAKEHMIDDHYDKDDMIANFLGVTTSSIVVWTFKF